MQFKEWVLAAGKSHPRVTYHLVTTHFHADHHDDQRVAGIKWTNWFHGVKSSGTPVRRDARHGGRGTC
jgi:hypothetical protein